MACRGLGPPIRVVGGRRNVVGGSPSTTSRAVTCRWRCPEGIEPEGDGMRQGRGSDPGKGGAAR